jgi:hypothetical protein
MAWESGYYYRVRRDNGRVVREYVGRGRRAEAIADLDALEREKGRLDAEALRNEQAELDALDADMEALTAAPYHIRQMPSLCRASDASRQHNATSGKQLRSGVCS